MNWAKYKVIGHRCSLEKDIDGSPLPFYCSSPITARVFSSYWGGEIVPL